MHFYNLRRDHSQQRWVATAMALKRFLFIWQRLDALLVDTRKVQENILDDKGCEEKKY